MPLLDQQTLPSAEQVRLAEQANETGQAGAPHGGQHAEPRGRHPVGRATQRFIIEGQCRRHHHVRDGGVLIVRANEAIDLAATDDSDEFA
ncbi:MAG: hypothetical protein ACRDGI_10125 [Candidatus Limnocylindrales bacterium]